MLNNVVGLSAFGGLTAFFGDIDKLSLSVKTLPQKQHIWFLPAH